MTDLADRVAIVTGAANGIGHATAVALADNGATVVGFDLRGSDVDIDITDADAVRAAVADVVTSYGRIDILVNVAGVAGDFTSVVDLDEASFDRIFAVHFKGTLHLCQAVLPTMIAAGSGAIVNTVSSAIDLGIANTASYSVAKSAIAMLTRTLAAEVGPQGITANAVAPGFVPTALALELPEGRDAESVTKGWERRAPLGRVGTTDDIAQQILYLVGPAGAFVTGQILRANGGVTMPW